MTNRLTEKIMQRIADDHLTHFPRWRFFLIRSLFWVCTTLAIILGSAAVGVMVFLGTDLHRHGFGDPPLSIGEFLPLIPFLWILVLCILLYIALEGIRHTRHGYRYTASTAVALSLVLCLLGGLVVSHIGVGRKLHEGLREVPLYQSVVSDSRAVWDHPQHGRLAGVVTSVTDVTHFTLRDFAGNFWYVTIAQSVAQRDAPTVHSTVRMRGILGPDNHFIAERIHPWEP